MSSAAGPSWHAMHGRTPTQACRTAHCWCMEFSGAVAGTTRLSNPQFAAVHTHQRLQMSTQPRGLMRQIWRQPVHLRWQ